MITNEANEKLKRYNNYCVHYNLVAEACYRRLAEINDAFDDSYLPYLVAALISFDMGRQMGKGTKGKYDPSANGFAARLQSKLNNIKPFISPILRESVTSIDFNKHDSAIKIAYNDLCQKEHGLHASGKSFHVGATKILHFLAPDLFPIVDSYASRVFRQELGVGYLLTTQPGYSAERYIEVMEKAGDVIRSYGENEFKNLEPPTPMMRIFDKIIFAHAGGWDEEVA